jgi:FdhD protein
MEVRDDEVVEPNGVAIEDQPRRLHGSLRLGAEPVFPEPRKTFNLRPSIDDLPEEQSLTIEINGRPVATLLCSPAGISELALGWLFAQGYFDDPDEVQRLTPYGDRISVMIARPGNGGASWRNVVASGFDASAIRTPRTSSAFEVTLDADEDASPRSLRFDQARFLAIAERVFARFRGDCGSDAIHHAAVTDGDHVCAISRDVCRHNAVDKVIGWTLSQRLDRSRLVLCLSGRVSADLAYKAVRAGLPIVATRSVPTCEAVELAHAARITLIGRVLEPQRAIYAHPWRLASSDEES